MKKPEFDMKTFLSTPTALQNAVRQIPCDMLRPYHNHRFELYTGERLEDMVESIKENGVLILIPHQHIDNIQSLEVMLIIVSAVRLQMTSQSLSTTLDRDGKTSFLKPFSRSSSHIC